MVLRRSHTLLIGQFCQNIRNFANGIASENSLVYYSNENSRSYSKPSIKKGKPAMNTVEQLIDFIKNLTPEQADKIIRQMPRLIALTEEPSQPELHQVS